jgi:hypothetical protein
MAAGYSVDSNVCFSAPWTTPPLIPGALWVFLIRDSHAFVKLQLLILLILQ